MPSGREGASWKLATLSREMKRWLDPLEGAQKVLRRCGYKPLFCQNVYACLHARRSQTPPRTGRDYRRPRPYRTCPAKTSVLLCCQGYSQGESNSGFKIEATVADLLRVLNDILLTPRPQPSAKTTLLAHF